MPDAFSFDLPTEDQLKGELVPQAAPITYDSIWAKSESELTEEEIDFVLEKKDLPKSYRFHGMEKRERAFRSLQRLRRLDALKKFRTDPDALDFLRSPMGKSGTFLGHIPNKLARLRTHEEQRFLGTETPWERLQDLYGYPEPQKAYEAFCMFRDLGVTRRMAKVQAVTGHSSTDLSEWRKHWLWDERIEAFDAKVARELAARVANLKAEAHVKMFENFNKLADINSKILNGEVDLATERTLNVLSETGQSETLELATKMHTALNGQRQEIKQEVGIALAAKILADPSNVML
jgi:hypothetical protein